MKNKIQKENNSLNLPNYEPLKDKLSTILENQKINKKQQDQILETTQKGFIGLALQNQQLMENNKQLKQQLKTVVAELNQIQRERQEKKIRKQIRANRKRLPKRDPMTLEAYKKLLKAAGGPAYTDVRLRVAICLLLITGIRINELLPLKVYQLQTLLESHWIAINRSKRGPSSHKAFLTREGRILVEQRKKDFQFLFLMKNPDSFIFTSELNHYKMLSRETLTKSINKKMRCVSQSLPDQPILTSHSFRIGYITKLWKDTEDIEFVRQSIGHRKIDTTSSYIEELSDQERGERTFQLT